jgi:hypothetical protein
MRWETFKAKAYDLEVEVGYYMVDGVQVTVWRGSDKVYDSRVIADNMHEALCLALWESGFEDDSVYIVESWGFELPYDEDE